MAVGDMPENLPSLLQALPSSKHQYLLLAALKEVLVYHVETEVSFEEFRDQAFAELFRHITADEEGVRNMVAECLGLLGHMAPGFVIPQLVGVLDSPAPAGAAKASGASVAVWTVTTAMRFALTRPVKPDNLGVFEQHIRRFMPLLTSDDLEARKAALLLVNTAVYYNAAVVRDLMDKEINPRLLETLKFTKVREVDLGPFKHKEDDGLPLRKVVLTCTETMLDACRDKMDLGLFLRGIIEHSIRDDQLKIQALQVRELPGFDSLSCLALPLLAGHNVSHLTSPPSSLSLSLSLSLSRLSRPSDRGQDLPPRPRSHSPRD
jgi:cullin-associated NEDD8-dissociated protein 1